MEDLTVRLNGRGIYYIKPRRFNPIRSGAYVFSFLISLETALVPLLWYPALSLLEVAFIATSVGSSRLLTLDIGVSQS